MTSTADIAASATYSGPAGRYRLLLDGVASIGAHRQRHGPLPDLSGNQIRALTEQAGLFGRGGAGFPTHRKLEAVAAGKRAVVIANASEGEPASSKDRALLKYGPHLVIDGLMLAARAVAAEETHIYVPVSSVDLVHVALSERRDMMPATVHVAPDAFVVGEESAVVSAVAGRLPIPQDKSVRIVERGLDGRPTLVQNVETLANLALIARYGPAWFRSQGTAADPGTFLATVSGAVVEPGVYEHPYGVRLGEVVDFAGGATEPLQAVLIGGYHGAWIPPDPDLEVSRAGLERYDANPGAGIVFALPASACGLVATAEMLSYLADQSVGQCGPCINGLPRIASTFAALAGLNAHPQLAAEVERLSHLVNGRGACKHPDGTVRLVRSGMRAFAREITSHVAGHCTARIGGRR